MVKVSVNKKPHPVSVERMYGLRGQSNHPLGNAIQIYDIKLHINKSKHFLTV